MYDSYSYVKLTPGVELILMIFTLIQGIPPIATKFVALFMTRIGRKNT